MKVVVNRSSFIIHPYTHPTFIGYLIINILLIDKVGFNGFQFKLKSIKSDCLGKHLIPPTTIFSSFILNFIFYTNIDRPTNLNLINKKWGWFHHSLTGGCFYHQRWWYTKTEMDTFNNVVKIEEVVPFSGSSVLTAQCLKLESNASARCYN